MERLRFSPKIEIINHFDDLIQRVDIDMEESLKMYNENQVLAELKCIQVKKRLIRDFRLNFFECEPTQSNKNNREHTVDQWSESTKVVDYLNQIRMRTIEELRKEQKESVENSSRFKSLINSDLTKEEKRSELFAEKFYFQVKIITPTKIPDMKPWVFNLFTFVTEFYIPQIDINLLEKFINTKVTKDTFSSRNNIFDEKMVLIVLLYKYFCNNIKKQKFPNHVINVFKQDILKIKKIEFDYSIRAIHLNSSSTDLSQLNMRNIKAKLDYIIIDSLSSLESLSLEFYSVKEISFKNLYALKELQLLSKETINLQTDLFDNLPNIENFSYSKKSMKFQFKKLEKSTFINICNILVWEDFNLDFFMNKFHKEIENLNISGSKIEVITRLLKEYSFPKLILLSFYSFYSFFSFFSNITRIEKKLINLVPPMIQTLNITNSYKLQIIDFDAFSDLKQLVSLDLNHNYTDSFDRRLFSGLFNLENLNLNHNLLKSLDEKIFSDLKNLKKLDLSGNILKTLDAKSFEGLENLNGLNLSYNSIEKIDHEAFSNLKQLVYLDLSENLINSLDRRLFSGLRNLESLYMKKNRLKQLDEHMFSDLKNLKDLRLSYNELEILDAKSFVGLENLNKLDLYDNKIDRFDVRIIDNLPEIKSIDLSKNKIDIDDIEILKGLNKNFIFDSNRVLNEM